MSVPTCPRQLPGRKRSCRTPQTVSTDGVGRTRFSCARCDWQQAGRCWQCGARRENPHVRTLYCDRCRHEAKRAADERHRSDPQVRKRDAARASKRWREQPEVRARKREHSRAWRLAHPEKVKASKRRSALNPTPARREAERRHNARPERIAQKRAQARARYYELHPTRPAPVCANCQTPITYVPPGRPKKHCDRCVPAAVLIKRKVAA